MSHPFQQVLQAYLALTGRLPCLELHRVLHTPYMLQVQVDASELSGFSVSAPEVIQHYKYKNMKAALANIPASKDIGGSVSTKVILGVPLLARPLACGKLQHLYVRNLGLLFVWQTCFKEVQVLRYSCCGLLHQSACMACKLGL